MSMMMAAAMRPLCESTNRPTPPPSNSSAAAAAAYHQQQSGGMESPIDMSVTSSSLKHRSSPPPPYRAPLPGSTYATALARPSVITQAPSKRERERERGEREMLANRENDNRSTESISTCDTVIDEHFRRSLGPNYAVLFGKKSPGHHPTTPSPQPSAIAMTATAGINTPTPTPPPPMSTQLAASTAQLQPQALVVAHPATHSALPPYHAPQALISPKPASVLLSSAAIFAAAAAAAAGQQPLNAAESSLSPRDQMEHMMAVDLPPPQQQPLALATTQRCASPQPTTPNANVDVGGGAVAKSPPMSPSCATLQSSTPPPPPLTFGSDSTLHSQASSEAHSTSHSRSPIVTPLQSPNSHAATATLTTPTPAMVSSSTPPTAAAAAAAITTTTTTTGGPTTPPPIMPAIIRIKTEPGLAAATNTPPASPTSTSSPSSITEVTASVDDHFAKALGDTWKKLQENKEVRK
ncbi:unnamed protein product [Ceratitis capitata]|uniref:(Mediterranean fruit fly) hypothetical protein n=1 Tax=Ceratitis capitata TaxID=7213 RepID=A0A811V5A3_CERCA|nr:unnamed protein product [Ceratitis capitata]